MACDDRLPGIPLNRQPARVRFVNDRDEMESITCELIELSHDAWGRRFLEVEADGKILRISSQDIGSITEVSPLEFLAEQAPPEEGQ